MKCRKNVVHRIFKRSIYKKLNGTFNLTFSMNHSTFESFRYKWIKIVLIDLTLTSSQM